MRLLKPQRLVDVSPAEEHSRCQLTWQAFDQLLHVAAFGTPEQLNACIALPKRVVQDRENIVLGFSDQVPVWVKVGQEKQLYYEDEVRSCKKDGVTWVTCLALGNHGNTTSRRTPPTACRSSGATTPQATTATVSR